MAGRIIAHSRDKPRKNAVLLETSGKGTHVVDAGNLGESAVVVRMQPMCISSRLEAALILRIRSSFSIADHLLREQLS